MDWQTGELILASASHVRRSLLEAAGLELKVIAAGLDEQAVRQAFTAGRDLGYPELARRLAAGKAREVSLRFPSAWVIAADQVLFSGDRLFVKAATMAAARTDLQTLRGRWHMLASAAAVAVAGEIIWDHVDTARLRMRKFSDAFLESYIARSGADVLTSVGGYKLEGLGIQLFERFEGDYFTVLGLPLLPVLAFLRSRGCLVK